MNDKEIMSNYLGLLKSNIEVYVHGTIESSFSKNEDVLKKSLDNTLNSKSRTFSIMQDHDFYSIQEATKSDINKLINKNKEN